MWALGTVLIMLQEENTEMVSFYCILLLFQVILIIIPWIWELAGVVLLILTSLLMLALFFVILSEDNPGGFDYLIVLFTGNVCPPFLSSIFLGTAYTRAIPASVMRKMFPENLHDRKLRWIRDITRSVALIWVSTYVFIMHAILDIGGFLSTGYGITIEIIGLLMLPVTIRIAWKRELTGGYIILAQGFVFFLIIHYSNLFIRNYSFFGLFKYIYFLALISSLLSGLLFILYSRLIKKSH